MDEFWQAMQTMMQAKVSNETQENYYWTKEVDALIQTATLARINLKSSIPDEVKRLINILMEQMDRRSSL